MIEIFINQVNHQVKKRRRAAAGDNVAFVNNHVAFLKRDPRKSVPEFIRENPVGGGAFPIQDS